MTVFVSQDFDVLDGFSQRVMPLGNRKLFKSLFRNIENVV